MKSQFNLETLSALLAIKRGDRAMRDIATEIGISAATISRIERGSTPDMGSFLLLCDWLEVPPGDFFQVSQQNDAQENIVNKLKFALLSDKNIKPAIAKALIILIEIAESPIQL